MNKKRKDELIAGDWEGLPMSAAVLIKAPIKPASTWNMKQDRRRILNHLNLIYILFCFSFSSFKHPIFCGFTSDSGTRAPESRTTLCSLTLALIWDFWERRRSILRKIFQSWERLFKKVCQEKVVRSIHSQVVIFHPLPDLYMAILWVAGGLLRYFSFLPF